jgi:hypothetical protein
VQPCAAESATESSLHSGSQTPGTPSPESRKPRYRSRTVTPTLTNPWGRGCTYLTVAAPDERAPVPGPNRGARQLCKIRSARQLTIEATMDL